MYKKIKYLLLILFTVSCSNYLATDPFASQDKEKSDIDYIIPQNADPKYFIKADFDEKKIESIMAEYFKKYGKYIIFLEDNKENIKKHKTIEKINNIIKKPAYLHNGVAVDFSRTNMDFINQNEFENNKNLIAVKLPNTLRTINNSSFKSCERLKAVNLPKSITEIRDSAFEGCISLENINIESQIKNLSAKAFKNCISLKKVTLPEGLISIADSAFNYCLSLETINFPSTLQTIGTASFYSCKSLKSIKLNSKLTKIDDNAFDLCSSLTSISLPDSITELGSKQGKVFADCNMLKKVEYLGKDSTKIKGMKDNTFENSKPEDLYLPNVPKDPNDKSWDNFLGVNWGKDKIHYGKPMPK